jgi:hypothetical protein
MVSPRQYRCQPANSERLAFRYVKGNTMAREGDAKTAASRSNGSLHTRSELNRAVASTLELPIPFRYAEYGAFRTSRRSSSGIPTSTHSNALHAQQSAQLAQLARNVTHSHGTMVRWSTHIPIVEEVPCANGETVSAVGVADLENWPGHGLSFSH